VLAEIEYGAVMPPLTSWPAVDTTRYRCSAPEAPAPGTDGTMTQAAWAVGSVILNWPGDSEVG